MNTEQINELSNKVIGYAIQIHKTLGPGFVERIYAKALAHEFKKNRINFTQERTIRIKYDNVLLENKEGSDLNFRN